MGSQEEAPSSAGGNLYAAQDQEATRGGGTHQMVGQTQGPPQPVQTVSLPLFSLILTWHKSESNQELKDSTVSEFISMLEGTYSEYLKLLVTYLGFI